MDDTALVTNIDGDQVFEIDLRMFKVINMYSYKNYLNTVKYNNIGYSLGDQHIFSGANNGKMCKFPNFKKFQIIINFSHLGEGKYW